MAKELSIENLESAAQKMRKVCVGKRPLYLKLSNAAIKMGFTAQSAEEFIRRELEEVG